MSELDNRPKPFSKNRFKITVSKLIFFYSVFFVVMKSIATFDNYPTLAAIILSLPFVLLAVWGFKNVKKESYTWSYVIVGILAISLIRYYEVDIFNYLVANYSTSSGV